jgi:cephalosporin-C deacetylase
MRHPFAFDPTYGYGLPDLLAIQPPPEPEGFAAFWRARYQRALAVDPAPQIVASSLRRRGFAVFDLCYRSTGDFAIRGWLLVPESRPARRGLVFGHGYGGLERPDLDTPCADAVYLVPCFRGLGASRCAALPSDPARHVVHGIAKPEDYLIGACVDDLWIGVTALLQLHPELSGALGYMGVSFGGGIGALALAWDRRLSRGHLEVPTFGHQRLRLRLPTLGSAVGVQNHAARHPEVADILDYFDAAIAARHIRQQMHIAAALFDPAVAPPGQFAIYNALPAKARLFVLQAGHFDYPARETQHRELMAELADFFA